jgi:selenocysteine lyase/cysteine desulfurase
MAASGSATMRKTWVPPLGYAGSARDQMLGAFRAFERHEDMLAERLLGRLRGRSGIRIIGEERVGQMGRMPIVSFVVDGIASEAIVRHVDQFDIGIRFRDFYAPRLIDPLGIDRRNGVVRVSARHYNLAEGIDRLIGHLHEVIPG